MEPQQAINAMKMMMKMFQTAATELKRIKKMQQEKEAEERKENIVEDEANSSVESTEAKEEKNDESAEKADETEEETKEKMEEKESEKTEEKMEENGLENKAEADEEVPEENIQREKFCELQWDSKKIEKNVQVQNNVPTLEALGESKLKERREKNSKPTKGGKKAPNKKWKNLKAKTLQWHRGCLQRSKVRRQRDSSRPQRTRKKMQKRRIIQEPKPPPPHRQDRCQGIRRLKAGANIFTVRSNLLNYFRPDVYSKVPVTRKLVKTSCGSAHNHFFETKISKT